MRNDGSELTSSTPKMLPLCPEWAKKVGQMLLITLLHLGCNFGPLYLHAGEKKPRTKFRKGHWRLKQEQPSISVTSESGKGMKEEENSKVQQKSTKWGVGLRAGAHSVFTEYSQYSSGEQMTPTYSRFWADTTRWFFTENWCAESLSTWCCGWEKLTWVKDDADRVSWVRNCTSKYREATTQPRSARGTNFWTQNLGQCSSALLVDTAGERIPGSGLTVLIYKLTSQEKIKININSDHSTVVRMNTVVRCLLFDVYLYLLTSPLYLPYSYHVVVSLLYAIDLIVCVLEYRDDHMTTIKIKTLQVCSYVKIL